LLIRLRDWLLICLGGDTSDNIDAEVGGLGLDREVHSIKEELENVKLEIGIVFHVEFLGGIALMSPAVWHSRSGLIIFGHAGDKELGVAKNVVHEGNLGQEVREEALELELEDVELVAYFSVDIEDTVVSNAGGVSVIEREPEGNDLPGDDVEPKGAQVVTEEVQIEIEIGLRVQFDLNEVIDNARSKFIFLNKSLVSSDSVGEIESEAKVSIDGVTQEFEVIVCIVGLHEGARE